MTTATKSRVLQKIPLLIAVCFVSIPTLAQYGDDTLVYQTQKEDFETGDFGKFPWEHGGDASWGTTKQERHSGTYSAQSASIEDGESATLRVTLDCVSSNITFFRKVSSESGFDYLKFYIDGVEEGAWSGRENWAEESFDVTAGTRTFEWTYSKDRSVSDGDDMSCIDDIVFPIKGRCFIEAGELRAILEDTGQGFRLLSLSDLATGTEFLGPMPTNYQLFQICLQNTEGEERAELWSESGWNLARIDSTDDWSWLITYESPTDSRFTGTRVTLPIRVETASNAIHLGLRVQGVREPWAVESVGFPKLQLANHGPQTRVLIPQGSGRVLKESFNYYGRYPSGSASMPYFAFYDSQGDAGLYVGTHDPWASWRDIAIRDKGEPDGILLIIAYPAPDSDQPGNGFEFPGEVVWQLFRGDWFDATVIYRDWVRTNAKWYPKLSENGREDTPLWMRELPVWIRSWNHARIEDDVSWAKQFSNSVGLPVGLRLYLWHEIPFDNDMPHYFPAKPGFAEAVTQLQGQKVPIYVMPYISGVYWDTRDRGMEDFQFTSVARTGAVKDEQGEVKTAAFGQESDGSPAQLAIMCPTTSAWKEKLQELVLHLTTEYDAKAVYMDGIGNLPPQLCFDHAHGHATGGGDWWAQGYWDILESIRRAMPRDCILTTESTAEAYVHVFDGFLVGWDYNGNVPAFPAIYGGAIQMFGRIYNFADRPTKVLAHRMQGGQAFVFGEQTGGALRLPAILQEPESLAFLTQIARLRWDLRRFLYAGEMARPPKLYGSIPTVSADWGGGGYENWVTTDAVMTGAWKIPHEQRLVLLFVNVSDEQLMATLNFDAATYGLPSGQLKGTVLISPVADQKAWGRYAPPGNPGEPSPIPSSFQWLLYFPQRYAWAWVIEP